VNLKPHKKDINEIILQRYYDLVNKRKEDERTEKERKKDIEKQDSLMAIRLLKSNIKTPVKRQKKASLKKTTEKDPAKNRNSAFFQDQHLSNELADVIGVEKTSRPQVVKLLWAYIKDNNLQNPDDKRQIVCDTKLQALFKKKSVGAFEMNKILSHHIFKLDEVHQPISEVDQNSDSSVNPEKSKSIKKVKKLAPEVQDSSSESEEQ